jgi:putative ABC transport system ATP-binding protein
LRFTPGQPNEKPRQNQFERSSRDSLTDVRYKETSHFINLNPTHAEGTPRRRLSTASFANWREFEQFFGVATTWGRFQSCYDRSFMIALNHVSKVFDGKRKAVALDDIQLEITKGQIVSIVGPSGSGKSTLLNLIGGLDRPSRGQIRIEGENLADLSDDDLTRVRRDKIGFVFQFFNLLPTLNCLENVALPLHLRKWPRKKIEDRAKELLELVQLGHRIDHLPDELSGGERQRVAIARALSVYPPILLADEPTGNLDTHTGQEILKLIDDLHERLGSTILIVTHDVEVANRSSRIVSLRDGRIVEDHRR